MIAVRRVLAVGTIVSLAAAVTCTHVWGDPKRDKDEEKRLLDWRLGKGDKPGDQIDRQFADEFNMNRFGDQSVVVYKTTEGDTLAAVQLKHDFKAEARLPRDILIMIDTSASKAQGPLANAIKIAEALVAKLDKEDRVAIWTVNTRAKSLTKGFLPAEKLVDGFKELAKEFPAGAVNLKQGLADALNGFDNLEGHQRALVFLGDGQSLAGPVDSDDRAKLCEEMVQREIAFYCVPLGPRPDPVNIHGFVNGTGGKVVRMLNEARIPNTIADLTAAFDAPILYPRKLQLPDGVVESMPSKLPPLRRDTATLLLCKVKPAATFDYTVTGTMAGKNVTAKVSLPMPKAEFENFFLASMYKQWRERKDRPAMMQADRALAFANDQNQMARADLLAKAAWALDQNQFDPALRLFKEAQALDPNCKEAKVGIDLVQQFRDGKINREQLRKEFEPNAKDMLVRFQGGEVKRVARPVDAAADPLGKADGPANILKEAEQRRAVADQQQRRLVDDAVIEAQRLVNTQPNEAHNSLKRTLDGVRTNPDISEPARIAMSDRLERALRDVDVRGAVVARNQAERLALEAFAQDRINREKLNQSRTNLIRERIEAFHVLMNEGRAQQAYIQTQALREDIIRQGQPIPQALASAERITLSSYHLKELRDLVRLREERWLATLLEVERSHIPFPDEPPVEFPNSAKIRVMTRGQFDNWEGLSKYRTERYSSAGFGPDMPKKAFEIKAKLGEVKKFGGFNDPKITLQEGLDVLMKANDITIDVNTRAFDYEGVKDVLKTPIAEQEIPPFTGTLSLVLKKILNKIPVPSGATFIIRRDTIEITTEKFAIAEKSIRVYPVGDLVIPIPPPGAFAQQNLLNQTGALGLTGGGVFGQVGALGALGLAGQIGALGQLGGGLGALGGGLGALGGGLGALGGGLGALGGGLGALGGGLGALGGGLGALGGGLGQLGALGGGLGQLGGGLGQLGGGLGQLGGGIGQLGGGLGQIGAIGGGGLGVAGQVGQIGQLGQVGQIGQQGQIGQLSQIGQAGQFGLQNNGQQQLLINLITQVVGTPKDWAPTFDPVTGLPTNPLMANDLEDRNQLGYYPPALALVVKGTSRIHSRAQGPQGPKDEAKGTFERAPKDAKGKPLDPKTTWQEALKKGVDDPGMIIACADYLVLNQEWTHAAEFLKANLRQGIIVEPWVYEALAVALRASSGSPEEIERAEVSAADLKPLDARGLLRAAQAAADQKHYDRAVAFCKQAAALQPNLATPYVDALQYAELGQDTKGMEWAAGNLLKQDWPTNNRENQARAMQKLESLVKTLEAKPDRREEARRISEAVIGQRRRDLVIKMAWQGETDLDLKVTEPSGSVCWALNRQSIGGGVLIGGTIADMTENEKTESYVAAKAFTGDYYIDVHRVYGKPLGEKAQLRVILHQGTKDERELPPITVDLRNAKTVKIHLDNGRRTEAAYVPPPSAEKQIEDAQADGSSDRVLYQLRNAAMPEFVGFDQSGGNRGGSIGGMPVADNTGIRRNDSSKDDRVLYQTKISSFVKDSMDLTAQAVLSADRRSVRVTVAPVYMPNNGKDPTAPAINNPLLPGAP